MHLAALVPGRKPGAWFAPRFTSKLARRIEYPQRFSRCASRCVAQLVHVKTPGLARGYAGRVARAAPGGPLTW